MNIRTAAIALLLVSFAGPASANDTVFAGGFDPVWVLGYHVGYEADDYPTDKVDFAAMSHVIIGVVTPNADGSLNTTFDIDTVNGPVWAKGVATAAHADGRKALLMIGGSNSSTGFEGAAGNSNRSTFVTHLLTAMDAAGADGLDLDWEPLDAADYTIFTALAQDLRNARPAMLLTAPVYAININLSTMPDPFFGAIAPLLDRIDVMTYDMEWPADGWKSWFTSALYDETATTPMSVDSSVSFYLDSGVPRSKLGVGIGFYGVCWHGVTGPRQTIGKNAGIYGSVNTYSYHNIVPRITRRRTTITTCRRRRRTWPTRLRSGPVTAATSCRTKTSSPLQPRATTCAATDWPARSSGTSAKAMCRKTSVTKMLFLTP